MTTIDNPEHLCIAKSVLPEEKLSYEQWKKKLRVSSAYIDPRFEKFLKEPYKGQVEFETSFFDNLKNIFQ